MSSESRSADPDAIRPMMLQYLDGALSPEDVAELNKRLRNSQALRREFAELLYEHALLAELCREKTWTSSESAIPLPASRKSGSWRLWLSAAAVVGILLVGWLLMKAHYPSPRISESVQVLGDGPLERGVFLATGEKPGSLALGGYCRLEIEPGSTLRIEGRKRDEGVFLQKGGVTCEVDHKDGEFAVRTEVGTVSVTGTKFSVQLFGKKGGREMITEAKKGLLVLAVVVMAGSVSVEYDGKSYELGAGSERVFGAEREKEEWTEGRAKAEKRIAELYKMFQDARKKAKPPRRGKGRIIGFVIDAETGETPEGTVIVGLNGKKVQDARPEKGGRLRGFYELAVDPGRWKVEVRAKGYKTPVEKIQVRPGTGSGMGTWRVFRLAKDRK